MKPITRNTLIVAVAAIAALGGYLAQRSIAPSPATGAPQVARDAGAPILALNLPDSKGANQALAQWRGKVLVVNFWATWCPPCLEEMPALERLWRKQKEGGFVMLAVTVDANPKLAAPFVEKHGFTFTVGFDPKMELANTYGVRALPSSFVIDRDGRLTAVAVGPRVWDNTAANALIERLTAR